MADTAGMPQLEVIENALNLTIMLRIKFDKAAVARRLEALRAGPLYRSDASSRSGDWESTSLAVGLLAKLGLKPPPVVTANIDAQIRESVKSRQPNQLFGYILPLLSLMTVSQVHDAASKVRDQLNWIGTQLPGLPPFERLAAAAELRHVAAWSGDTPWSRAAVCRGLRAGINGVQVVANSGADAQATVDALSMGCRHEVDMPPWTPGGWPNQQSATGAVAASIAGIRIADHIGISGEYRAPLLAQLKHVWFSAPPGNLQEDSAGVAMLCRILGVRAPLSHFEPALPDALAAPPTAQAVPVLLQAWMQGVRYDPAGQAIATRGAATDIFAASAAELEYRITGDRKLDEMSRGILASLAVGNGLYATAKGGGLALSRASAVATAIADWILRVPVPVRALQRAGLCDQQLACGQPVGLNSSLDSTLRATAAILTMMHPDAVSFPMGL